jgi:hypothetical protein
MMGLSGAEMVRIGIRPAAAQRVSVSRRAIVAGALASLLPGGALRAFASAESAGFVLAAGWVLAADDVVPGAGAFESLDAGR